MGKFQGMLIDIHGHISLQRTLGLAREVTGADSEADGCEDSTRPLNTPAPMNTLTCHTRVFVFQIIV